MRQGGRGNKGRLKFEEKSSSLNNKISTEGRFPVFSMFSCISDVFQDFFVVAEEKLIKCCFLMLSVSFNSVTIKPVLGQITNQQCSDTKPIRVARLLRRKNLMQQLDLNPRFLGQKT